MKNIYFFVPCDIYIRDFDARLITVLSVIKYVKNVKFIIGSQHEVNKFIIKNNNIKKMIYLEKGIDTRYSSWYYYLAKRGCLIYTLSEEGGIFEKNRNLVSFDIDTDNLDLIRKNFIWSNLIYEEIIKNKKKFFNHSEFLVTGNPRFDLCSENFNDFYDNFLEQYKKKKCIVISSTFTSGNSSVPDELKIIRLISKKNYLKSSYQFDKVRKKYSNELRNHFIKLTKEISNENPDIQIFFRPHPVESHDIYKKHFQNFENIIVNNSVPARDMIAISDTLIHHDCTTAIECFLNNKKPIAYLPIFDENVAQEIPIKVSYIKKSIIEVKNQLTEILKNKNFVDLKKSNLEYFLENFNNNSYEKISNVLIEDIKNFNSLKLKKPVKFKIKSLLNYLIAIYVRFNRLIIEKFSGLFSQKKFSKHNKFSKNIELNELKNKIQILSKKIILKKQLKIKKLNNNLFMIEDE
ncbi:MAG: hypothetical protein CBC25_07580 [Pelagibacteraceae bacterium TMED65]|nr:MAG: hypothetical protein CBC25_07580 [Pelagibacteraceae bacterium TMED65]